MRPIITMILAPLLVATAGFAAEKAQNPWDPNYVVSETTVRAIEEAMPDKPFVLPARPRKLLIYGRKPTHPMSVACCFKAIETMGKKTGAFETVASGDPLVFLPENLAQFDAVLMNNMHEQHPMLPINFDKLSEKEKSAAREQEAMLQKSLIDFVAGGKGVAGVHAAIAGGWPEYLEMMGGSYGGHFTTNVWVKPDVPGHPLCASLKGQSFQLYDEIYFSSVRNFRKNLRTLWSVDLQKTPDPGKREDGDYVISWVRSYGKGHVFYCSLGHEASSYYNPHVLRHYLAGIQFALGDLDADSTPEQAAQRHGQVTERRKDVQIICHRGASEFAHENTLEAYRATFELGGDGNEVDIRATKDGVLVSFHDDMLDRLMEAYGDVSDHTWAELQRFSFRNPGRFGEQSRVPALVEVLDLHRQYDGLLHLDIKRPGIDEAIADLLTRMDLWDHVAYCNVENSGVILRDPRLKLRRYKAPGLYLDRSEVFPDAIGVALEKSGDGVIVDDPRGVALALGRKLGKLSKEPVSMRWPPRKEAKLPSEAELVAILRQADDWDQVAETAADKAASGQRIRTRAEAAEQLLARKASSEEAFAALEERVRNRSLHKDWCYHGLDGAASLRILILLRTPKAIDTARFALWRDDPALEPVVNPVWKNPRAWTDFRVKMVIFPALEKCPGLATEKLCRDYLALSDDVARQLGPPQLFEEASKALLAVSPRTETALELMKHRLQTVRGRAILECLARGKEPWARAALEQGAPHALAFQTDDCASPLP